MVYDVAKIDLRKLNSPAARAGVAFTYRFQLKRKAENQARNFHL